MAQILEFDRFGGPEVLKFRDIDPRMPEGEEVRYKVRSFALNRGDLFWMADTYYNSPMLPARVGQEAYGIVDAVGEDVTGFAVGDRVCSIVQEDGQYCVNGQAALTLERYLVHWSGKDSPEEACAMWSQALTAYYAFIELAALRAGETVLITGGSSTSGTGAIQLAKLLGARVIATSRSFDKREFILSTGPADGGDRRQRRRCRVRHRWRNNYGTYLEALSSNARVYIVGALEGDLGLHGSILPLVRSGSSITGFSVFNHNRSDDELNRAKAFISAAIQNGRLRPFVDRVFPFSQTIEANYYLASGQQCGKVVVVV